MRTWLRELFSDDDGTASTSRVLTAVAVLSACAALLIVTLKTGQLPDGGTLTGLGAFCGAIGGVLYGANQLRASKSDVAPPQS